MATTFKSRFFSLLPGLLWLCPALAWGAEPPSPIILIPDDPSSVAIIDGPWEAPIQLRVITLADAPLLPVGGAFDPALPGRFATAIADPDGALIHLNLVETAEIVTTVNTRRGPREFVEWIVNTDLPFTRHAELQAAAEGVDIRRPRTFGETGTGEIVCHVTGQPVIEVFVQFDPSRNRVHSYGLVTDLMGGGGSWTGGIFREPPVKIEGGDPGGDSDPPGGPIENGGGGGGPPEGGDPGGDHDPPARVQ